MTSGHLQHERDAERWQRRMLVVKPCQLLLLDLVEYCVAHTLHQAVRRVRSDLALDNEDPWMLQRSSIGGMAPQEVVDPLGKLFFGSDLL